MKQNESHVIYTMTGLMAAAFIAATAYTGFNPAEIIPQLGEGWKFFTEDFLPPQVSFSRHGMYCCDDFPGHIVSLCRGSAGRRGRRIRQ